MKVCAKCKIEKPLLDFHRRGDAKHRHRSRCIPCYRETLNAKWIKTRTKMTDDARVASIKSAQKRFNSKPGRKAKQAHQQRLRVAAKLNATPKWLTENQLAHIRAHYETAQIIKREFGELLEVDHIIPLRGKDVCGLHVPWNLQLMAKSANCQKSNKYEN